MKLASSFAEILLPNFQLGVGAKVGAEAVIHAVRLAFKEHPEWVALKIDFVNAFNSIDRSLIQAQLVEHFPSLLPYFRARYGTTTRLTIPVLDNDFIMSETGVQQGNPLGPFFFALGLQALLNRDQVSRDLRAAAQPPSETPASDSEPLNTPFASVPLAFLLLAFLDDLIFVGDLKSFSPVVRAFLERCDDPSRPTGLAPRWDKCVVWSPNLSSSQCRHLVSQFIPAIDLDVERGCKFPDGSLGFKLLGAYIGSPRFCSDMLCADVASKEDGLRKLLDLPSVQERILLLRFCAGPDANFFLRTSPPSESREAAALHDDNIIKYFGKAQGFVGRHDFWKRIVQLPKRKAGVGLLSATDLAGIAYVGSIADCAKLLCPTVNAKTSPFAAIRGVFEAWLGITPESGTVPSGATWPGCDELANIVTAFSHRVDIARSIRPSFAEKVESDPAKLPRRTSDLLRADRKLQHSLSVLHHTMVFDDILRQVPVPLQKKLISHTCQGASTMYDVIPSCPSLTLGNDAFVNFSVQYQCVADLDHPVLQCTCSQPIPPQPGLAGATVTFPRVELRDSNGTRPSSHTPHPVPSHHFDSCKLGDGTRVHHDECFGAITDCLKAAGYPATSYAHLRDHDQLTPDGESLHYPSVNSGALFEFGITCPSNASSGATAGKRLFAASLYEQTKLSKYRDLADAQDKIVIAVVMESTCAFGRGLQSILTTCQANHNADLFAETESQRTWAAPSFKHYWSQVITVAFWRGAYQKRLRQVQSFTGKSLAQLLTGSAPPSRTGPRGRLPSSRRSSAPTCDRDDTPSFLRLPPFPFPFTPPLPPPPPLAPLSPHLPATTLSTR